MTPHFFDKQVLRIPSPDSLKGYRASSRGTSRTTVRLVVAKGHRRGTELSYDVDVGIVRPKTH